MTDKRADGEPLPISLVAHHVFCPRRAWLEAMGEKTGTHQMAVGLREHRASDDPAASCGGRVRSVDIASQHLGVIGRCNAVEFDHTGAATVIEYKATPVRRRAEVTEPMTVQLALQAQALRESGYEVKGAAVYFTLHQVPQATSAPSRPCSRAKYARGKGCDSRRGPAGLPETR